MTENALKIQIICKNKGVSSYVLVAEEVSPAVTTKAEDSCGPYQQAPRQAMLVKSYHMPFRSPLCPLHLLRAALVRNAPVATHGYRGCAKFPQCKATLGMNSWHAHTGSTNQLPVCVKEVEMRIEWVRRDYRLNRDRWKLAITGAWPGN